MRRKMDVYICGIGEAYAYERIARGETRCYVCFGDLFYVLNLYSHADQNYANSLFLTSCTDESIIRRICVARDTGEFSQFSSGTIIDLDNKRDKLSPVILAPNKRHLIRHSGNLYMIMYRKYSNVVTDQRMTCNHYDNEQMLEELKGLLVAEGFLRDVEYCGIIMTEIQLLYHD